MFPNEEISLEVYRAMQVGRPFRSYIKTPISKVYVTIFDPLKRKETGLILSGNPRAKKNDTAIVDVWSEMEDVFFKRLNRRHFEQGTIIPYTRSTVVEEKTIEQYTDEELKVVLSQKFAALNATISTINELAPINRLLYLAREEEKSEKIVRLIEARLADIQEKEFTGQE